MIPLPVRRAQAEMSVFVEVGWSNDVNDRVLPRPGEGSVRLRLGAGVSANFAAAKVGYRRMDKVFINHLHGDHMSDLIHTYCFGPAGDRKSPLYVWGSEPTGVESPTNSGIYLRRRDQQFLRAPAGDPAVALGELQLPGDRATRTTCRPPRQAGGCRVDPVPVGDDSNNDAYAIVPIELDWRQVGGVAYSNAATGVKITHFPVIHARKGSMGYKLEWQTPDGTNLTMIYTSDTKPETNCVEQAKNGGKGVDVFIHEMVVPPGSVGL